MFLRSNLRQLKYPREFRISQPYLKGDLGNLEHLLNEVIKKVAAGGGDDGGGGTSLMPEENNRFLADVATGLWRLRIKMTNPGTNEPLGEMRRPFRHLESVWDALAQAGIEIIDHTNEPFDAGMAIKAISFQPTAGLNREMIIETIKPTIYNGDTKIQMGEVFVGIPEN